MLLTHRIVYKFLFHTDRREKEKMEKYLTHGSPLLVISEEPVIYIHSTAIISCLLSGS